MPRRPSGHRVQHVTTMPYPTATDRRALAADRPGSRRGGDVAVRFLRHGRRALRSNTSRVRGTRASSVVSACATARDLPVVQRLVLVRGRADATVPQRHQLVPELRTAGPDLAVHVVDVAALPGLRARSGCVVTYSAATKPPNDRPKHGDLLGGRDDIGRPRPRRRRSAACTRPGPQTDPNGRCPAPERIWERSGR